MVLRSGAGADAGRAGRFEPPVRGPAQSTEVDALVRTGSPTEPASRSRVAASRQQAELVAGGVGEDPPGQRRPSRGGAHARPARRRARRRRPASSSVSRRMSRWSRFLPAPLGRGSAAELQERAPARRVSQGGGHAPSRPAATRTARPRTPRPAPGSALSSGSAAIGPDAAYSGRSSMTQNGLPSGSASTTHGHVVLTDVEVAGAERERALARPPPGARPR